jgi:hypothetical protein
MPTLLSGIEGSVGAENEQFRASRFKHGGAQDHVFVQHHIAAALPMISGLFGRNP